MSKFVALLALVCVAATLVQAQMPVFKFRKDLNKITFGDPKHHQRRNRGAIHERHNRQADGDYGFGFGGGHHHEEHFGGHYEHHSSGGGGDDHHHHHEDKHHHKGPKFATYFSASGRKGFGRRNKGGHINFGLIAG